MKNEVRQISLSNFDALPLTEERFSPCIYDVTGLGTMYVDGRLTASVDVTDDAGLSVLGISTWDCGYPGNGYSLAALDWLRTRFDRIVVYGAGEVDEAGVGDIATAYWLHMHEKGLVDVILLDDGSEITPETYNAPSVSISKP